jgi:hypothetical protein
MRRMLRPQPIGAPLLLVCMLAWMGCHDVSGPLTPRDRLPALLTNHDGPDTCFAVDCRPLTQDEIEYMEFIIMTGYRDDDPICLELKIKAWQSLQSGRMFVAQTPTFQGGDYDGLYDKRDQTTYIYEGRFSVPGDLKKTTIHESYHEWSNSSPPEDPEPPAFTAEAQCLVL